MTKIYCVVNDESLPGSKLKSRHGLSLWIEMDHGAVLFDTGQDADILSHNLKELELSPIDLNALVFSHGHYDHTGGVAAIYPERTTIPLYANSDLFNARYETKNDVYKSVGIPTTEKELSHYFYLRLSDDPVEVIPGLWTTGKIKSRPEAMGSSDNHYTHTPDGWQPDAYQDDLSMVLKTSQGNVLICGCCHAGLLNTIYQAERDFGGPFIAVLGGTHLISATDETLDNVASVFQERYPNCDFYLNHCSGKHAIDRFKEKFRERVKPFYAGSIVEFDG